MFGLVLGAGIVLAVACVGPNPDTGQHGDTIFWNGVHYQPPLGTRGGRPLTDDDLGREQFRVRNTVLRARTPLTDRDASYIPAGEPVFAVNGYDTRFRLAARHDGRLFLYESGPYLAARRGADLMDIEARVLSIGFYQYCFEGCGPVARLEDRSRVEALVRSISTAPVDLSPPWGRRGEAFVLMSFDLVDGTRTVRGYNRDRNAFSDVIYPDESFRTAIDEVMRPCAPSCWR
jgi:hypothetical protein